MAESMENRIAIILETFGAAGVVKQFNKVQLGITNQTNALKKYGLTAKEANGEMATSLNKQSKALVNNEKAVNKAKTSVKKFRMEYLGIMFAGMAVDRMMSKLFKGMIKDYKEFTKEAATPLSNALIGLEANWKFLKFSMMDAMSGFLTGALDWVSGFVNNLAKANPALLKAIGIALLSVAAAAKLFMIGGQIALGLNAFDILLSRWSSGKALKAAQGLEATSKSLISFKQAAAGLVGISLGVAAVFNFKNILSEDGNTWLQRITGALESVGAGAGIGFMVGGPAGAAIGALIGLGISIIVSVLDFAWEHNFDAKIITWFAGLIDYVKNIWNRFQSSQALNVDLELDPNVLSTWEKPSFKDKLKNAFSMKESFGPDSEYRTAMDNLKNDASEIDGPELGSALGESTTTALNDTLVPGTNTIFEQMGTNGAEFLTVDMTNAVNTFLNDSDSGMAALQNAADELNSTLAQPINKTVNITTVGGGTSMNFSSSSNNNTLG